MAGETVVIEAGFAEGDDFGMASQLAERRTEVVGSLEGV